MDYLLIYDYSADYLERRAEFRNEHLCLAWQAQKESGLVLAGVLANPIDSAVFYFRCDLPRGIEEFVHADPYVQNGLVTRWQIREWVTVVGEKATSPVYPIIS